MSGHCTEAMAPSKVFVEAMESRRLLSAFAAHIDFQPADSATPSGYVADTGAVYANRANGMTYGWNTPRPAPVVEHNRHKGGGADQRYDTFAVMHPSGRGSRWQIAVPDGGYTVSITAGDPMQSSGRCRVLVDGVELINAKVTPKQRWV